MRLSLLAVLALGLFVSSPRAQTTADVNPFVGTEGTGHTFPGAAVPFGMVQPSPDNRSGGWAYTAGYQYSDPQILGFSQTHISGAGVPELGDVLLLPFVGDVPDPLRETYRKETETARPGYYAVTLDGSGTRVELTASPRVAVHRYTFAAPGRVRVLVDLQHGLTFGDRDRVLSAEARVTADGVEASVWASNWVRRETHAVVRFDHPVVAQDTLPARPGDRAPRLVLTLDLGTSRTLLVRAALSTVSVGGAYHNLGEALDTPFDRVAADADARWAELLGRVQVAADARTRRLVATALYHALLHPSDIADRDGRVRGPDGMVVHAPGGVYYSTLSLWDTFRAAHPLYTLIVPERVPGFAATLLAHSRAQGYLPLWTAWGRETHTMIGNPALPVLADAVVKGFDVDARAAFEAARRSSTVPHYNSEWDVYDRVGYYPYDQVRTESVSKTLEAGIGDAALARLAAHVGEGADAARFAGRAQSYRALFDPDARLPRARR